MIVEQDHFLLLQTREGELLNKLITLTCQTYATLAIFVELAEDLSARTMRLRSDSVQ